MTSFRSNLFSIDTVKRPAFPGCLLVSEPFLRESYFRHAVISLVTTDSENDGTTMGVVLNNVTNVTLDRVVEGVETDCSIPVFCGGPCSQDRLYFVHTLGNGIIPGASAYAPGLWIGGDFDAMLNYVNSGYRTEGVVRFFLGYSGWDRGQLDRELDKNVWAVTDIATVGASTESSVSVADLLTLYSDRIWHRVVRAMGPHYRAWNFHPMLSGAN